MVVWILSAGAAFQLPALHGHGLPCVSFVRRILKIQDFHRSRCAAAGDGGLIAHLWYPLLPWIFTLYICWSPWHYTGQNYGLMMMFARRAGLSPTENERQALHLSFVASFLMLMLSFQTGASGDPTHLVVGIAGEIYVARARGSGCFFYWQQRLGAFFRWRARRLGGRCCRRPRW